MKIKSKNDLENKLRCLKNNNNSSQLIEIIVKNENLLKEIEVLKSIKKENYNLHEKISELNQQIQNLINENRLTTEINKELRDFNEENNKKDFLNKSKTKQLQEEIIAIYVDDYNAIKSDNENINNKITRIRKERNEIKEK